MIPDLQVRQMGEKRTVQKFALAGLNELVIGHKVCTLWSFFPPASWRNTCFRPSACKDLAVYKGLSLLPI